MNIKEFNSALQSVPYTEVTAKTHTDLEMWCEKHVIIFDLDCDIEVIYTSGATYLQPEEAEFKETTELSNIRLFPQDSETECVLNKVQCAKLEQEMKDNIKVVY